MIFFRMKFSPTRMSYEKSSIHLPPKSLSTSENRPIGRPPGGSVNHWRSSYPVILSGVFSPVLDVLLKYIPGWVSLVGSRSITSKVKIYAARFNR